MGGFDREKVLDPWPLVMQTFKGLALVGLAFVGRLGTRLPRGPQYGSQSLIREHENIKVKTLSLDIASLQCVRATETGLHAPHERRRVYTTSSATPGFHQVNIRQFLTPSFGRHHERGRT
jgi:hypothetical protein